MMKKRPLGKPNPKMRSGSSETPPRRGASGAGATIDPLNLPEERDSAQPSPSQPRPLPAPGVPMSRHEYERLKERAKTSRAPPLKHAQEDPAETK